MTVLFLLVSLVFITVMAYKMNNGEICAPAVLFCAPFVLCSFFALCNEQEWNWDANINTALVVLVGTIFFLFGTWFGNKIKISNNIREGVEEISGMNTNKIYILVFLHGLCYVWKLRCMFQFGQKIGVGNNLSKILVYINNTTKFSSTDMNIQYPQLLSIGLEICTATGFVVACLLAYSLLEMRKNKHLLLVCTVDFAVCVVGSLTSGGRGGAIQLIFSFLGTFLILYQRKYLWKRSVPLKYLARVGVGIILAGVGFFAVITLIGRYEVNLVWRYLSNYIGAQLFNLDYYLNSKFESSVIFGQETFQPIIQFFAGKFGISKWSRYTLDLPMVTAAGYNTGNVYTTFYPYIHDFGVVGLLLCPFIMGAIVQVIYRKARNSQDGYTVDIWLVVYSNVIYMLVFSFFSNKIYELLFSIQMLKKILWMFVTLYYFYKINRVGMKIKYKKII